MCEYKSTQYFVSLKIIFFLCICIYKIVNITEEMYKNNSIEVITDNLNTLWIN